MESNKYGRLISTTKEIEEEELNWWKKNAEIETIFCWVQPVKYQKILRGDFLKDLKSNLNPDSRILELGCGTGWLLFLLHEYGFKNLYGIDFSKEQIQIAEKRKEQLLEGKENIRFDVGGFNLLESKNLKFDYIICHGFLHHLSELEIQNILSKIPTFLNNDGHLLIWEPFIYSRKDDGKMAKFMKIRRLFARGGILGRKITDKETYYRNLINQRHEGQELRGPSPKEIPFTKEEMKELLKSNYQIIREKRFMSFSHLIGQELLLMALSHPNLVKGIETLILKTAKYFENKFLRKKDINSPFWIFELIECKLIK